MSSQPIKTQRVQFALYAQSLGSLCWASVRVLGRRFALARQIRAERQVLASLSDAALHDIGITRIAANTESSRSVFDLPANRTDATNASGRFALPKV